MIPIDDMSPNILADICRKTRSIEFVTVKDKALARSPLTLEQQPDRSFAAAEFSVDITANGAIAHAYLCDAKGERLFQMPATETLQEGIRLSTRNVAAGNTLTITRFCIAPYRS